MACKGWMYEPDSGERQEVIVTAQGHSLVLATPRGERSIDPECLYPVEKRRNAEVYALRGRAGFRLGLTSIEDHLVESRLPEFPSESGNFHPLFLVFVALSMLAVMAVVLTV